MKYGDTIRREIERDRYTGPVSSFEWAMLAVNDLLHEWRERGFDANHLHIRREITDDKFAIEFVYQPSHEEYAEMLANSENIYLEQRAPHEGLMIDFVEDTEFTQRVSRCE